MGKVAVRPCAKGDEKDIMNICYRTGYMGEDLTGRGIFNDVKLFGNLFCLYYPRYERENCFVAEKDGTIVGYILGTCDSSAKDKGFAARMVWRIAIRLFFYTLFVHRESFKAVFHFIKGAGHKGLPENLYNDYPAHLHINVLPEHQHGGTGSILLESFEEHMRKMGVKGIHLFTSNKNTKAVPFYIKKGYTLLHEGEEELWPNTEGYRSLLFAKKLTGA
jgi:GNAT superfamily N-acetyltransferase